MEPDGIRIRRAVLDDAETIVAFNIAMAAESEGRSLVREVVARGVRRVFDDPARGTYFLAEDAAGAVGQLMVTREHSDWRDGEFWWIQSVYVRPEYRRRGVYRALHAHVEAQARLAGGVCGLRLYVDRDNAAAKAVYARLGMRATDYELYEVDWNERSGG